MKELATRAISGAIYVSLLLISLKWSYVLIGVFFVFGVICLMEFNKLIHLKSVVPYIIFFILYLCFGFWNESIGYENGFSEAVQILQVITIFVLLFLIKDLFSEKTDPTFQYQTLHYYNILPLQWFCILNPYCTFQQNVHTLSATRMFYFGMG